ncbi:MAG TPA: hypothetical protein VER17_08760 [Tepidisphaeraceae bacterium]|nr:hypothetical protein [Tepidisphaeraceae bacterium]
MHVEDLKRWHWAFVAIVVGLALSYVWTSVEWDENLPTIGQREFEAGLTIPYPQPGHLAKVTVQPPIDGKYKVVAEQMRNGATAGVMDVRPVAFIADTPYRAGEWRGGDGDTFPSVMDYLAKAKELDPQVTYAFAWYRQPWAVYTLWTGASLLLIAGVWPSIISLMVGAGLGFHKADKGPEYDLDRFKREADAKKAAPAGPSAADVDHLRQLEEELEKKLKAKELGLPMPEDEPAPATTATGVRKLDGGPLEAATIEKPTEEHEFRGEFYPVDRGAKKAHE